jgi:cobalt-zinc-cadmium efflux system outer membrane protein
MTLVVAAVTAMATTPLTVDEAVREALQHNSSLMADRYTVTVADAAVLTASLRPNPVVTVSGTRPDSPLVDAGISPYEQVVRFDLVMERGGKRSRRVDQATLGKSLAELQLADTTRLLVLDVERAFTDVQLEKLNVALAEDTLKAFNDVVAVNTERVRTGDLAQAELGRSRLAALQFQNEVREHQLRLRAARNRLSLLIGRGGDGERVDTAGDLRHDGREISLEEVRRQAQQTRPDIRALRQDQARSVADERLQLANGRVDYTLSGEYHRQEGSLLRGNSYAFSFSTPVPLFNRNQGEIARARAQESALATKVQALERAIANDVATVFGEYSVARELVDTIETQMLAQARDVRAATEYAYRRGEASFIEFLDAQRVFNDTIRGYNEARAQYARSLYALDALTATGGRP